MPRYFGNFGSIISIPNPLPISGAVDVTDRAARLVGVITAANLDVALSTRALESGGNLASIFGQLDVKLSTRAVESGGNLASIFGQLDVKLSTRAVESGGNLATIAGTRDSTANEIGTISKAKGKTVIRAWNTATNGSTTIYTVTAAKTFYLVAAILASSITAANTSGAGYIQCDVGGNGSFVPLTLARLGCAAAALTYPNVSAPISPSIPIPFIAGTVFQVGSSAANLIADGVVVGWEE
jgi:hypothetical protein